MKKKVIFFLLMFFSIIMLIFIINKKLQKDELAIQLAEEQFKYLYGQENPNILTSEKKPSLTNISNLYFTVDSCIKKYFLYLDLKKSEYLLPVLNEEYISNNNITKDNIFEKIEKYSNYDSYRTYEEYNLSGVSYSSYYVKGKIDGKYVYYELGLDISNDTFDIMPISSDEYSKKIDTVSNPTSGKEKTISKKTYNLILYKKYNDDETGIVYLCDYFYLMLNDIDQAYTMLNDEFKNSKFKNVNEFRNYINNNKEKIELIYKLGTLDSNDFESFDEYYNFKEKNKRYKPEIFLINKEEDYTQYICTNENNDYYIINVYNPGNYDVMLDNSILDLK